MDLPSSSTIGGRLFSPSQRIPITANLLPWLATNMVVGRAEEDHVEPAKLPDLRMPAKGLTGAEIRAFSF